MGLPSSDVRRHIESKLVPALVPVPLFEEFSQAGSRFVLAGDDYHSQIIRNHKDKCPGDVESGHLARCLIHQ